MKGSSNRDLARGENSGCRYAVLGGISTGALFLLVKTHKI